MPTNAEQADRDAMLRIRDEGSIRIITMIGTRMNALSHRLRTQLFEALCTAAAAPTVAAILLAADGPAWCAGADLKEMDSPESEAYPSLQGAIFDLFARMDKPVIAVIAGMALGGGLELALGCHYRLATPGAMFGLPEVTLGLIPGAGGTQHLPRAVGLEEAAKLILSGQTWRADSLAEKGLFDAILASDGDPVPEAIRFAQKLPHGERPPLLRDRSINHPDVDSFLAGLRAGYELNPHCTTGHLPAVACLHAAATLPYAQAMAYEYETFCALRADPASQVFRQAFLAQRRGSKSGA